MKQRLKKRKEGLKEIRKVAQNLLVNMFIFINQETFCLVHFLICKNQCVVCYSNVIFFNSLELTELEDSVVCQIFII